MVENIYQELEYLQGTRSGTVSHLCYMWRCRLCLIYGGCAYYCVGPVPMYKCLVPMFVGGDAGDCNLFLLCIHYVNMLAFTINMHRMLVYFNL